LPLLNIVFLLLVHFKFDLLLIFSLISYMGNICIFVLYFLKTYIVAWAEWRGDSLVLVPSSNIQDYPSALRPKCPQSSNWHKTVVQDCSPRRAVHSLNVGFSLIRGRCWPRHQGLLSKSHVSGASRWFTTSSSRGLDGLPNGCKQ
jgi:hypothetical protein